MANIRQALAGRRRRVVISGTAAFLLATLLSTSLGESPGGPVIRVEEDWKLVLNVPDGTVDAPQLHTAMSAFGHFDSSYAQVTWNYREVPYFRPGGLQIQAWDGDGLSFAMSFGSSQLSTIAETITWTQGLLTDGQMLSFKITNGQSTTWGAFGGGHMGVAGTAYVANLNGYSTDVSAENSWITYGANRVDLLMITEVRRYGPDGLISVDSTPRIIHQP